MSKPTPDAIDRDRARELYQALQKTNVPPKKDFEHFYGNLQGSPEFRGAIYGVLNETQSQHGLKLPGTYDQFFDDYLKKKVQGSPASQGLQSAGLAQRQNVPSLDESGNYVAAQPSALELSLQQNAPLTPEQLDQRQADSQRDFYWQNMGPGFNTKEGREAAAQEIAKETLKTAEIYEREGLLRLAKTKAESKFGITAEQLKALPAENREQWKKLNPQLYDAVLKADRGDMTNEDLYSLVETLGASPEDRSSVIQQAAGSAQQASAERLTRILSVYPEAKGMATKAKKISDEVRAINFDVAQSLDDLRRLQEDVDPAINEIKVKRSAAELEVNKTKAAYEAAAKKGDAALFKKAEQAYEKSVAAYNAITMTPEQKAKIDLFNKRSDEVNAGVDRMKPMLAEIDAMKANPGLQAVLQVYEMNEREYQAVADYVESKSDTYYQKIVGENFAKAAVEFSINPYKAVTMQFLGSLAKTTSAAVNSVLDRPEAAEDVRDYINGLPMWSNSQVYAMAKPKNLIQKTPLTGETYVAWDRAPVFVYDQILRMSPYLLAAASGVGAAGVIGATAFSVYDDMYQEARDSGLSAKESAALAGISSVITGAIEKLNPIEKVFVMKAGKKAMSTTLSQATAKGWAKARNNSVEFMQAFGKNFIEQFPAELMEEFADGTKDKILKQAFGLEYDKWTGEEAGEVALGTALVVATLGGAGAAYNQSKWRSHALNSYVRNGEADAVRDNLWDRVQTGEIDLPQFNAINKELMKFEKMNDITSSWTPTRTEGSTAPVGVEVPTDAELVPTPDDIAINDDATGKAPDPGTPEPIIAPEEKEERQEELVSGEEPDVDESLLPKPESQKIQPIGQQRMAVEQERSAVLAEKQGLETQMEAAKTDKDLAKQLELKDQIRAQDDRLADLDKRQEEGSKADAKQVGDMITEVSDEMGIELDEEVRDAIVESFIQPFIDEQIIAGQMPDVDKIKTSIKQSIEMLVPEEMRPEAVKKPKPKKPPEDPPVSSGGQQVVEERPKKAKATGSVQFKDVSGKDLSGEAIDLPGFEQFDIVATRDGMAYQLYDLYTGTKILPNDIAAFSQDEAMREALDLLLTKGFTPEKMIRAQEKAGRTNFSPAVEAREEQKRLERENAPLLIEDPELRKSIEDAIERAKSGGALTYAATLENQLKSRKSKYFSATTITPKNLSQRLEEELAAAEDQRRKAEDQPLDAKRKKPLPPFQQDIEEVLMGHYNKKNKAHEISPELESAITAGLKAERALRQHFGYYKKGLTTYGDEGLFYLNSYRIAAANAKSEERNAQAQDYERKILEYPAKIQELVDKYLPNGIPDENIEPVAAPAQPAKPQGPTEYPVVKKVGKHASPFKFDKFKLGINEKVGKAFGHGVYMSTEKDPTSKNFTLKNIDDSISATIDAVRAGENIKWDEEGPKNDAATLLTKALKKVKKGEKNDIKALIAETATSLTKEGRVPYSQEDIGLAQDFYEKYKSKLQSAYLYDIEYDADGMFANTTVRISAQPKGLVDAMKNMPAEFQSTIERAIAEDWQYLDLYNMLGKDAEKIAKEGQSVNKIVSDAFDAVGISGQEHDGAILVYNDEKVNVTGRQEVSIEGGEMEKEVFGNNKPVSPEPAKPQGPTEYPVVGSHQDNPYFKAIKERYEQAEKYYGRTRSFTKPNGDRIMVRYVLLADANDVGASHMKGTFKMTPGVPVGPDGKTLNDRDYAADAKAQGVVLTMAAKYKALASQVIPVVTSEGIVVNGNNRFISRQIAADNGTDTQYIEDLPEEMVSAQIDGSLVAEMRAPMLAYEIVGDVDLNTAEYASWNHKDTKAQSPTERAIGIAKTMTPEQSNRMAKIMAQDSQKNSVKELQKFLSETGFVPANELAAFTQEDGMFNDSGLELIENIALATMFDDVALRSLNRDGAKQYRDKITKSLLPLMLNDKLKPEFRVLPDIMSAIELSVKIKDKGMSFVDVVQQMDLFDSNRPTRNTAIMYWMLQKFAGSQQVMNTFIAGVNAIGNPEFSQSQDMFGDRMSPQEGVARQYEMTLEIMKVATVKADGKSSPLIDALTLAAINTLPKTTATPQAKPQRPAGLTDAISEINGLLDGSINPQAITPVKAAGNLAVTLKDPRGRLLNPEQSKELQAEIEANYDDGIVFGSKSNDIRTAMFSIDEPMIEGTFGGINVKLAMGLNRRKPDGTLEPTFLVYINDEVRAEVYNKEDGKAIMDAVRAIALGQSSLGNQQSPSSGPRLAPSAQEPAAKPRRQRRSDLVDPEIEKAQQDMINELRKGELSMNINPKLITLAANLTRAYVKKGVYLISEMIEDIYIVHGPELAKQIGTAIKAAYVNVKNLYNVAEMQSIDQVQQFNVQSYVEQLEFEDSQPDNQEADGSPTGDQPGVPSGAPQDGDAAGLPNETGGALRPGPQAGDGDGQQPRGGRTGSSGSNYTGGRNPGVNEQQGGRSNGVGQAESEGVLRPRGRDYVAPPDFDHPASFSKTQRFDANIKALEVLVQLQEEERMATPEEQDVLSQYAGWGGLKMIAVDTSRRMNDEESRFADRINRAQELMLKLDPSKELLNEAKSSVTTSFYTARPVIRAIHEGLKHAGFKGGNILEPSAGTGEMKAVAPNGLQKSGKWTMVEKDGLTSMIAKQLHQNAVVMNAPFEKSMVPENYFDLVIANFPFGTDIRVSDSAFSSKGPAQSRSTSKIHNYFALRTLDKLRPGGISAFITTHSMLDNDNDALVRAHIQSNAKILAAIRLPSSAFSSNAGTQVITDLIVLQKPKIGEKVNNKINILGRKAMSFDVPGRNPVTLEVPLHFAENPENVLGTLGVRTSQYNWEINVEGSSLNELEKQIVEAMKRQIPKDVYKPGQAAEPDTREIIGAIPGLRNGNLHMKNGKPYIYTVDQNGRASLEPYLGKTPERIPFLIGIREALNDLVAAETGYKEVDDLETLRRKLNQAYDIAVKKFGAINKWVILKWESDRYNLMALEKMSSDGKTVLGKADIMLRRVLNPVVKREPGSLSAIDAAYVSMAERGFLDGDFVAELTGKPVEDAVAEMGEAVFELPEGGYELKELYLSGNIYQKLDQAQKAQMIDPERYGRNVAELSKVLPAAKSLDDIIVQFGTPFVSAVDYSRFLESIMGGTIVVSPPVNREGVLHINPSKSRVGSMGNTNYSIADGEGKTRMEAIKLVNLMLADSRIAINDTIELPDGKKLTVLNETLTAQARQAAENIKSEFEAWMYEDRQARQEFEYRYNRSENAHVRPQYDGSYLTYPGMSGVMQPRQHQNSAVSMILINNGGYIDHMVGAGKTLVMITAAMKLKQTGMANKVALVVLKSTVGQIADSFKAMYPGARILAPRSVDFERVNRNKMIAQIANNDWDVVLLTHEQMGQIPVTPERETQVIKEQIDDLRESIEASNEDGSSQTKAHKEMVKRLENLEASLETKMDAIRSSQDIDQRYFEQTGIDHVMVDEAHMFKNLAYSTRKGQLAGLGTPKGNQKTSSLLGKIRSIQERLQGDKGVTFLSGTPVTNSIAELYNIFKYLRPQELDRREIRTFDAFTQRYAKSGTKVEYDVSGRPKAKDRLREFIELQALSMFYFTMADVRNDLNLTLPKPVLKDGKMTMVESVMGELETEFSYRLMSFASSSEKSNNIFNVLQIPDPPQGPEAYKAKMILATTYASKAAIDLRLMYPNAPYNPQGKIGKLVDKAMELYEMTSADRGAQLVFSDIGVPKSPNPVENLYDEMLLYSDQDPEDLDSAFAETRDPDTGEIKTFRKIKEVYDRLEKLGEDIDEIQALYAEVNRPQAEAEGFKNVYVEVKKRLMLAGVPAEEIQFIHDWKTDARKAILMNKVQTGEVRFVIGGTKNLGTGVNVQDKLIAVHHLDVPWTPAALEQRNGRLIRQGAALVAKYTGTAENPHGTAEVFAYVTPKTLDGMKYNLLYIKHSFGNKFRSGQLTENSMKDSDDDADVLAEMAAAIMGDNRILNLSNLQRERKELDSQYRAWQNKYRQASAQKDAALRSIEKREKLFEKFDSDSELFAKNVKRDEDGKIIFDLELDGRRFGPDQIREAGVALKNLDAQMKVDYNFAINQSKKIGSVYGFDYYVKKVSADIGGQVSRLEYFVKSPLTEQTYTKSTAPQLPESEGLIAVDALNRLKTLENAKQLNEKALENERSSIAGFDRVMSEPFGQSEKMQEINTEIERLSLELGGQDAQVEPPINYGIDFREYWTPKQRMENGMNAAWDDVVKTWNDIASDSLGFASKPMNPFDFSKEAAFMKALFRAVAMEVKAGAKSVADFASKAGLTPSQLLDRAWKAVMDARNYLRSHPVTKTAGVLRPQAAVQFSEEMGLVIDNSMGDVLGLLFNLDVARTFYAGKPGDSQAQISIALIEKAIAEMPQTTYNDAVRYLNGVVGEQLNASASAFTLSAAPEVSRKSLRTAFADLKLKIHKNFSQFEPLRQMERQLRESSGLPQTGVSIATMFESSLGVNARAESDMMDFYRNVIKPIEDIAQDFEKYLFWMRIKDRNDRDADSRKTGAFTSTEANLALDQMRSNMTAENWDRIETAGQAFQQAFDNLLKQAVAADMLSPDSYAAIKEANDFYVGFQLVVEDHETGKPSEEGIRGNVIKRIKGISDADFRLRNILEVASETVYKARKQQDGNRNLVKLVETLTKLDPKGKQIKRIRLIQPFTDPETGVTSLRRITPQTRPGMALLYYRKAGKIRAVEVRSDVAEAFAYSSNGAAGIFLAVLNAGQYLLKAGATAFNISFLPVNLGFYDAPRLATMSKYGLQKIKGTKIINPFDIAVFTMDIAYSFATVIVGKNLGDRNQLYEKAVKSKIMGRYFEQMAREYQEFTSTEAAGYTFTSLNNPEAFRNKLNIRYGEQNLAARGIAGVKSFYDFFMTSIINPFEQTTKFAALRRAKRIEGVDVEMSALEKSNKELYDKMMAEVINYGGSPNFLKSGKSSKWFNAGFPYFMARLNSITADASRLMGADHTEGTQETRDSHARLIQLIAIPSAMLTLYHILTGLDYDDEDSPYYVPPKIADNNWVLMTDQTYIDAKGRTRFMYYTIPAVGAIKWYKQAGETAVRAIHDAAPSYVAGYAAETLVDMLPINISGDNGVERMESFVSGTNPLFKSMAEITFNRNLFFHRDIVPAKFKYGNQQFLPEYLKYDENAPMIYRNAAAKLNKNFGVDVSPHILEQATKSMTADLITQFVPKPADGGIPMATKYPFLRRLYRVTTPEENQQYEKLKVFLEGLAVSEIDLKQRAAEAVEQRKGMAPEEILAFDQKLYASDPQLAQAVLSHIRTENRPDLTWIEKRYTNVNQFNRAQAIWTAELRGMPADRQKKRVDELLAKRVINYSVKQKLDDYIAGKFDGDAR